MRGKPYIKIMYPEASEAAMLLTEAMIRRSSGKRIVETTSEERESSGDLLFADACGHNTDTSVELQLNLAPEAMDFALATLIGRNLTEEEKRAVRMATDSTEVVDLLSPRAEAGASTCTEAVGTLREPTEEAEKSGEQEKKIEIGKIPDRDLRTILADLVDAAQGYVQGGQDAWEKHIENAIEIAIKEIDHRAGVIALDETYEKDKEKIEFGNTEADKPETDQNLTRMLAVLLYATPNPDWDKEDISNFADVVFSAANRSRGRFVDIGTLCELIAEAEYIATELKSNATTPAILERLENQEGAATPRSSKYPDARRQTAQALAGLIYWTPRNISNKKQRDSIQYTCSKIWALLERYPAASILAREIVGSLHHIYTEVSNGYKPSDCIDCIEREITGCWSGPIPDFETDKILLFSEPTDDGVEDDGEIEPGLLDDVEDGCAPAGEVIGHDE